MDSPDSTSSAFPSSLLVARRKAEAAWKAERQAWDFIESRPSPTREEMLPWYDLWIAAYDAQAEFDESIEHWSRSAKLL